MLIQTDGGEVVWWARGNLGVVAIPAIHGTTPVAFVSWLYRPDTLNLALSRVKCRRHRVGDRSLHRHPLSIASASVPLRAASGTPRLA